MLSEISRTVEKTGGEGEWLQACQVELYCFLNVNSEDLVLKE